VIFIDVKHAKWLLLFIASTLAFLVSINPAACQEVALLLHENITLENCTLQVVDIDFQAAEVWLLQIEPEPPLSMVLGINDSMNCGRQTLMVTAIYAGQAADLVCFRVNSS
jgi:hypothetical protein